MRYTRLAPLDVDAAAVRDAAVTVVGAGATGSRMLEQLARHGADIHVIDRDYLEEQNLATSALYTAADVDDALPKAVAAGQHLQAINDDLAVETSVADLDHRTADRLLGTADLVLDGTDNMATRHLINEWCVKNGIPWVHVAALGSAGTAMPVVPADPADAGDRRSRSDLPPGSPGACFNCVFGHVDGSRLATCETAGISPAAAAVAAGLGVTAALELLAGEHDDGLRRFDLAADRFERLDAARREDCPVCGQEEFPHLAGEAGATATRVCGADTYQVNPGTAVDLTAVAEKLGGMGTVEQNQHLLRFENEDAEFTLFGDGRMIADAESAGEARSVYARYVGD